MSITSCQQKIPLFHSYYNIPPIMVEPSSAQTIQEAIIYTFFVNNNHFGLTKTEVTQYMLNTFTQYDFASIDSAFTVLIANGVLVTLQAICVNWCKNQCPLKKFAISKNLDKLPIYSSLIFYLIQLAGGTQTTTAVFNNWFLANRNLQGSLITSTKRSAFLPFLA
jgi:hypothetical protein